MPAVGIAHKNWLKGKAMGSKTMTDNLDLIHLKPTREWDLLPLFVQQSDPEANVMAAFTVEDPNDQNAFILKWTGVLNNPEITMRSIFIAETLVGSVLVYRMEGEPQLSYWIGKQWWGKGVATQAVRLLLETFTERPLFASAAEDNVRSRAVLAKCGFQPVGTETGYANARSAEITEVIYRLPGQ